MHNFYCMFDQIIAALLSRRDFFQKHKKVPCFWPVVYLVHWFRLLCLDVWHMSVCSRWVQERGALSPLTCTKMPRPPPTTERWAVRCKQPVFSLVLSACIWAATASMCQICPLAPVCLISELLWIRMHHTLIIQAFLMIADTIHLINNFRWSFGVCQTRKIIVIQSIIQVFTLQCIGHTRLTRAFLLKGEDSTQCMFCKVPLSVKHILLDCPAFNVCRKLFYEVNSLKEFSIILPEKVLELLSYVNVKNLV